MNARTISAVVLLLATIAYGLAPLYRAAADLPIATHHVLHAFMIAGAAFAGILLAGSLERERPGGAPWLIISTLAPVLAMLLMWPSEYSYFEQHTYGHIAEHLGLVGLGFLAGFGGQRYANGVGWAAGLGIVAMAVLGVWGYGVGPVSSASNAPATPVAAAPPVNAAPVVAHGAVLYKQNCAACHGATGGGGVGPSLQNESTRKSLAQAEAWIEHPAPPMPQLFPSPLSAQDVADVAGYIETLR